MRILRIMGLVIFSVASLSVGQGSAASEPTFDVSETGQSWISRSPSNASNLSSGKLARKRYPGGLDEDDLRVQATLPNPNRGLEAQEAPESGASESTERSE